MTRVPISRRRFLRGGANTIIALPALGALRAHAAPSAAPKRLVAFVTSNGSFPERFWPRLPGQPEFPGDYVGTRGTYLSGLTALDTSEFTLSPILDPLARHRADLLVVEGLDNARGTGGHREYAGLLTGWNVRPLEPGGVEPRGRSIDQVLATEFGRELRIPALQLGVNVGELGRHLGNVSYHDTGKMAPPQNDPTVVFGRLFGSRALDPRALDTLREARRSTLDLALGQIADLESRLDASDRRKLADYLASFREVERRLVSSGQQLPGCVRPRVDPVELKSNAAMPATAKAQLDLLAVAFACDLTRFVTFQIGAEASNIGHPWLGVTTGMHALSHSNDSNLAAFRQITDVNRWYAEQLASLVDRLKAIPEGTGTVFDNTIIVWLVGLTKGNQHSNKNCPTVVLGTGGGALRTGRYVRLARNPSVKRENVPVGGSLGDLHATLLAAMGLPVTTFGDPRYFTGPLSVLRS